jgi:hypothetical protein
MRSAAWRLPHLPLPTSPYFQFANVKGLDTAWAIASPWVWLTYRRMKAEVLRRWSALCVAAASNLMTRPARWGTKRGRSRPAAARSSGRSDERATSTGSGFVDPQRTRRADRRVNRSIAWSPQCLLSRGVAIGAAREAEARCTFKTRREARGATWLCSAQDYQPGAAPGRDVDSCTRDEAERVRPRRTDPRRSMAQHPPNRS